MWHKMADNQLPVCGIMGNAWPRGEHYDCYTEYIVDHNGTEQFINLDNIN